MYSERNDHANGINLTQLKAQATGILKVHMPQSLHGKTVSST